jgi:hypothetical protein
MSQRLREKFHLIFNCHRAFEKLKGKRYLVNIRGNNSRNEKSDTRSDDQSSLGVSNEE